MAPSDQAFSDSDLEHGWLDRPREQRQRGFVTGYRTGDLARCDTFSAPSL